MTITTFHQKNPCFLIIQTAFTGDTILATAVIEKIVFFFPNASIDVLVRKGNEEIFENHPYIRRLYTWDKHNGKYLQFFNLSERIRTTKYDYCINLQRHYTTSLLTLLSGAHETVGFSTNPLSLFYTRRFPYRLDAAVGLTHEVDLFLQLLTGIVPSTERVKPRLYPSTDDYLRVMPNGPYVTVAPTSIWFTKQYPLEKWVEVINLFDSNTTVYLIGGKSDKDACELIKKQSRHPCVKNLAGELTLLQAAALMKKAKMNYVNDSAPLHLATAMDAPVTAVFCSTIPSFGFGPLGENSRIVETKEKLSCRPCGFHGKKKCRLGNFKCAQIPADEVVGSIR